MPRVRRWPRETDDVECPRCQCGVGNGCVTKDGRTTGTHAARRDARYGRRRWFRPVDVKDDEYVLVLAHSDRQAIRWMEETERRVRVTRYADSARAVCGSRPQVIVCLPGWFDHPEADMIAAVLQRMVVMQRPRLVHVYEEGVTA